MQGAVRRLSRRVSRRRDNLANELVSFQGVNLAALERILADIISGAAAPDVTLLVCTTAVGTEWAVGDTVRPLPSGGDASPMQKKPSAGALASLQGLVSRLGTEQRRRGWRRRRDGSQGPAEFPPSKFRAKTRDEWTVEDVLLYAILPRTASKREKLVEQLDKAQRGAPYAGVFVSHAHGASFRDLVEALGAYFQRKGTPPADRLVWLDVCSANHHLLSGRAAPALQDKFQVLLESGLHKALSRFSQRVVFFDRLQHPRALERAWVVWELFGMVRAAGEPPLGLSDAQKDSDATPFEVILTPHDEAELPEMLLGDFRAVQAIFAAFDARAARAADAAPGVADALDVSGMAEEVEDEDSGRNSDAALLHAIFGDLKGGYAEVTGTVLAAVRSAMLDKVLAAVRKRASVVGVDTPAAADLQVAAGRLLAEEQLFDEAILLLRSALETRRARFGPDDLRVGRVLGYLGTALSDQGKPNEAFKAVICYQEELAIARMALPQNHPDVATVLNNLACLLEDLGRLDEALSCFLEALEIRRQQPGAGQPEEEAVVLVNLGSLHHGAGRFDEALAHTEAALELYRRLNPSHPQIPELLSNMAVIYHSKGMTAQAMAQLKRAEAAAKDPVARVDIQLLMANLLDAGGELDAALTLYESALQALVQIHGAKHVQCAAVLNYIGTCLHALGRDAEALPRYDEALEVRRDILGEAHPDTAQVLFNRAQSLRALGRLEAALDSSRLAHEAYRRTCGGAHPDTVDAREQLESIRDELSKAKPRSAAAAARSAAAAAAAVPAPPAAASGASGGRRGSALALALGRKPKKEKEQAAAPVAGGATTPESAATARTQPPLPSTAPPAEASLAGAAPKLGASGRAVSRRMQRAVSTRMRIPIDGTI